LALLLTYSWPGNIRQLLNVARYAVAVNQTGTITTDDLPSDVSSMPNAAVSAASNTHAELPERDRLIAVLRRHRWKVSASAKELGIGRTTMYRRMKQLDIVPPNRMY
jgi:transcriptional regulator of acetoin/glycerol metabolism